MTTVPIVTREPVGAPTENASAAGHPSSLAAGGTLLALAALLANGGNYLLNLALGRWLPPAQFADASLVVTLMLTVTAVALGLQLVVARHVAAAPADPATARLITVLRRVALVGGTALGLVLVVADSALQQLFHSASALPFAVLGSGLPLYLLQAVERGVLQGGLRFRRLAASFVVETAVRCGVSAGLIAAGAGVTGAATGLTLSFVATWLVVRPRRGTTHPRPAGVPVVPAAVTAGPAGARRYAGLVAVLLVAQVVVANGDVLIAKAVLTPTAAAGYVAVALVGRGVFFLSWTAATVLFPAVARRHAEGAPAGRLLGGGVAAVVGLGTACTLAALLVGGPALEFVLGPDYTGRSGQLAVYALATTLFATANLLASHHLSTGRVREAAVLLVGGVAQTVVLLVVPPDAAALVDAQLVTAAAMLAAVTASHLLTRSPARTSS